MALTVDEKLSRPGDGSRGTMCDYHWSFVLDVIYTLWPFAFKHFLGRTFLKQKESNYPDLLENIPEGNGLSTDCFLRSIFLVHS